MNKLEKILTIAGFILVIISFAGIWNLVKSQSFFLPSTEPDTTILFKNIIPHEYIQTYDCRTGIQNIYYLEQDNPLQIVIYKNYSDAMDYLNAHFHKVLNDWISDDNQFIVTMTSTKENLYLIKQKYYETSINTQQGTKNLLHSTTLPLGQ